MPVRDQTVDLVRVVEGVRGRVPMVMDLVVRFDYGSVVPWVRHVDGALRCIAGPDALCLTTPVHVAGRGLPTRGRVHGRARATGCRSCSPGTRRTRTAPPGSTPHEAVARTTDVLAGLDRAVAPTTATWRDLVQRSLITLKALTYAPTGGIVAAPTTSLPEWIGGVRNWDYRYCWLRDATFTLYSLMSAGYTDEAQRVARLAAARRRRRSRQDLQIMYGAAGERRLTEFEVDWLPGYEGSAPVRIGNAAYSQFQLDVYGEVLDALHQARHIGHRRGPERVGARSVRCSTSSSPAWKEPDEGIWEVRGPRRDFTHSKVMAWVAFDRAVKAVEEFGLEGPVDRWRALPRRDPPRGAASRASTPSATRSRSTTARRRSTRAR